MAEPVIDLRSDTVTKPTAAMRKAMAEADVGDDMSAEDPTVNRLEAMVCEMFGMEAAVYACSGTQSNQMGVRAHCRSGDELLIHETGHIANFEAGAPAVLSGVSCRMLHGPHGMIDVPALVGKVRAANQHFAQTRLICIENTTNVGGGHAYPLEQLARIDAWAKEHHLKVHMDGARLFNACVAKGYTPKQACEHVDTVSVCFSKGLGCPMGSILAGSKDDIAHARRSRKLFGGALRQAGIVAASAIYALENNVTRLEEDHRNARVFAELIAEIDGIRVNSMDVETNLVFFEVEPNLGSAAQLSTALKQRGVRINATGPHRLRACFHLDVSRGQMERAAYNMAECMKAGILQIDAGGAAMGPYARA